MNTESNRIAMTSLGKIKSNKCENPNFEGEFLVLFNLYLVQLQSEIKENLRDDITIYWNLIEHFGGRERFPILMKNVPISG